MLMNILTLNFEVLYTLVEIQVLHSLNVKNCTLFSLPEVLVCEWGLSPFEKAIIPFVIFFWMAIGSIISGKS